MCWAALAAVVLGIDVHAAVTGRNTLSSCYRDATRTHPIVVSLGTAYLLAHLYGALPLSCDPLRRAAERITKGTS